VTPAWARLDDAADGHPAEQRLDAGSGQGNVEGGLNVTACAAAAAVDDVGNLPHARGKFAHLERRRALVGFKQLGERGLPREQVAKLVGNQLERAVIEVRGELFDGHFASEGIGKRWSVEDRAMPSASLLKQEPLSHQAIEERADRRIGERLRKMEFDVLGGHQTVVIDDFGDLLLAREELPDFGWKCAPVTGEIIRGPQPRTRSTHSPPADPN